VNIQKFADKKTVVVPIQNTRQKRRRPKEKRRGGRRIEMVLTVCKRCKQIKQSKYSRICDDCWEKEMKARRNSWMLVGYE